MGNKKYVGMLVPTHILCHLHVSMKSINYMFVVIYFHYFSIFHGICNVTVIYTLTNIQEIIKYYLDTK